MPGKLVSKALGESFTFTVKNTSGASKIIALTAAFFATLILAATTVDGDPDGYVSTVTPKYSGAAEIAAAGYACDAVLDDGTMITGVEAYSANSEKSIRQFREYIKNMPRVVVDMSVQANNVAAFNQTMKVITCSPLTGDTVQYLPLSKFYSVDQSSNSKINVRDMNLELGYDKLVLLPVANGHEITVTFDFS